MKLSVVIPLYNKEKYIERCINSLLNQDLSTNEYEIIIIDDGSTDNSNSLVQDISNIHSNVRVISQKNKGVSAARNNGLEIAKGDYIYFLDADDYLAPNVVKNLLDLAYKYHLEILEFKSSNTTDGSLTDSKSEIPQNISEHVMDGITFIGEHGYRTEVWWCIFKRSFLQGTGIKFIEGRIAEDLPFMSDLIAQAKRVAKTKLDVHRFHKVENSIQTNTDDTHLLKYIRDFVFVIEELDRLTKNIDNSHKSFNKAVARIKKKQQFVVFALFIRAFRCKILEFDELKNILDRLKELNVYPINPKIGGFGGTKKSRQIFRFTLVPICNNRPLLFTALRIKRLIA